MITSKARMRWIISNIDKIKPEHVLEVADFFRGMAKKKKAFAKGLEVTERFFNTFSSDIQMKARDKFADRHLKLVEIWNLQDEYDRLESQREAAGETPGMTTYRTWRKQYGSKHDSLEKQIEELRQDLNLTYDWVYTEKETRPREAPKEEVIQHIEAELAINDYNVLVKEIDEASPYQLEDKDISKLLSDGTWDSLLEIFTSLQTDASDSFDDLFPKGFKRKRKMGTKIIWLDLKVVDDFLDEYRKRLSDFKELVHDKIKEVPRYVIDPTWRMEPGPPMQIILGDWSEPVEGNITYSPFRRIDYYGKKINFKLETGRGGMVAILPDRLRKDLFIASKTSPRLTSKVIYRHEWEDVPKKNLIKIGENLVSWLNSLERKYKFPSGLRAFPSSKELHPSKPRAVMSEYRVYSYEEIEKIFQSIGVDVVIPEMFYYAGVTYSWGEVVIVPISKQRELVIIGGLGKKWFMWKKTKNSGRLYGPDTDGEWKNLDDLLAIYYRKKKIKKKISTDLGSKVLITLGNMLDQTESDFSDTTTAEVANKMNIKIERVKGALANLEKKGYVWSDEEWKVLGVGPGAGDLILYMSPKGWERYKELK